MSAISNNPGFMALMTRHRAWLTDPVDGHYGTPELFERGLRNPRRDGMPAA